MSEKLPHGPKSFSLESRYTELLDELKENFGMSYTDSVRMGLVSLKRHLDKAEDPDIECAKLKVQLSRTKSGRTPLSSDLSALLQ